MDVDVVHIVQGTAAAGVRRQVQGRRPDRAQYPNADHYQMLAYCTALEVPTAWLVYANGPQGRRRIVNSDVTVMEHSLDLSAEPAALLAQVDTLATTAWNVASARVSTGARLRPA